jgi:hypothetical protein
VNRSLTGLRVLVEREGGLVYGVARVRYLHGHRYAETYEIETAEGDSFLAAWNECTPAANWDVTPREGRFTGAQIFTPRFLDGTGREFLERGHGVLIPGSMKDLWTLLDPVRKGWTVEWFSHGANEFRGTLTVSEREESAFRLTGKVAFHYSWPTVGEEFEIQGNALHEVRVPHARLGKGLSRSLSLTFKRP